MIKRLLIILFLLTILSGCWDENEPERMLYINGIGVDYKDGKFEVYAQLINFANIAKSEQPNTDVVQAEVGHAKGDTLDEAIFNLYHTVDQKIFWGHLTFLIVSEEVLNQTNLSPIIDTFIRFRETRYQIWVYTTKDPVEEILLIKPVLNRAIPLSKLGDPKNSYSQESYIQPINLRQLIIWMNEPSHEAMIPYIKIKENWKSEKESIKAPDLDGVGVATPNGFKGFITGDKARGIQWMTNETKRGQVTFKSEGGYPLTVMIEKVKVKVDPVVLKADVTFDIDVNLEVTVSFIKGKATSKQIQQEVKKQVEKEIRDTYEEALKKDIDIYRLSEYVYRKEMKAWKKYNTDGKVELTENSIRKLNVSITKINSDRKSFKETIGQ